MTMLEVLVGNLLLYLFMARCYGNSSKMSLVYILSIYYVIISLLGIVVFETGIYENVFAVKNIIFAVLIHISYMPFVFIALQP